MYAKPFPYYSFVSKEELLDYECSDRIIIPKLYSESLAMRAKDLIFIKNSSGDTIVGTIYETHDLSNNVIYVPSWIYWSHNLIGEICISHALKKTWGAIQIRPQSSAFQAQRDFLPQLNKGVLNYSSLQQNTRIPINCGDEIEFVYIEGAVPLENKYCSLQGCAEMDIQIFLAKDNPAVTALPKNKYLFSSPIKEVYPYAFLGKGHILDVGTQVSNPHPTSAASLAAAAAQKRMLGK